MKPSIKFILVSSSVFVLLMSAVVAKAGGWDNFKLRYYFLTSYFHNQEKELNDLRAQNIIPSESTRIDLTQLLDGGPPKDGIPSIDNPQFDTAETTPFNREELVIGVIVEGEAKAYPFGIMNWHEIVNDTVGGTPLTIAYCPLCDTIVVFERGDTTYGVSGKLYQSCLVMYDRADDTLYVQPWAIGSVGSNVNRALERVPAVKTTLGAWLEQHPDSQILSTRTGHNRDYFQYPYGSYYTDESLVFPVRNQEQRELHPKTIISYVWEADNQTPLNQFSGSSYPFVHDELQEVGSQVVEFNGRQIHARWDEALETVVVEELDGTLIPSTTAFAFVYPAFFSD